MAHRLRRVSLLLTLPAFLIKLQMKSGVVETAWLFARVNGTHSFAEPGADMGKPPILAPPLKGFQLQRCMLAGWNCG